MRALIVTGTDTGIGKTVVSAMLMLALGGTYWKPIQSGTADGTDTQHVRGLTALPASHFVPERYVLSQPLSPHRAAELDSITIEPERLAVLPDAGSDRTLIIEGAGGVLVPITRSLLQADLFARWNTPAVLAARTTLGTINHTLLSLEALRHRHIPVLGVIFVGDPMPDTERTISDMGKVKRLGRLPRLTSINAAALSQVFIEQFSRSDFEVAP